MVPDRVPYRAAFGSLAPETLIQISDAQNRERIFFKGRKFESSHQSGSLPILSGLQAQQGKNRRSQIGRLDIQFDAISLETIMSSPIAKKREEMNLLHKSLNAIHKRFSRSKRIEVLSEGLTRYVKNAVGNRKGVRCLDVGCGDLGISKRIRDGVPGTIWQCLDIYDLPDHLAEDKYWKHYKKFNGRDFPLEDESVDIVLFSDMLHHANENIPYLMKEAYRVGQTIIIKDVFEYSLYSRFMLMVMDIVGNWGYGVPLPKKYFTNESFETLCQISGFRIIEMEIGVQIYEHIPILRNLLRPEWHFFAVLEKPASL